MGDDGWLETYTFPVEARLKNDPRRTKQVYDAVVKRTLSFGTTTAMYFATIDVEPTKTLVDTTIKYGQRAIIGKVSMDRNSPCTYCQSTHQNLEGTKEIISYIQNHPSPIQQRQRTNSNPTLLPLVLPMVVPRFIPTCTPELLEGLGMIVSQLQQEGQLCYVTSHLSESIDEVEFSRSLIRQDYKTTMTDAQVFDKHNLLTNRCVMAHAVLLSDDDVQLMKDRGSSIAHCPLSNFYFAGHTLPCQQLMTTHKEFKIGLGTDVAGGYHPSMIDSSRMAVLASLSLSQQQQQQQQQRCDSCEEQEIDFMSSELSYRAIAMESNRMEKRKSSDQKDGQKNTSTKSGVDPTLDYRHAFYLATLGGAIALSLDSSIGTLQVGMEFDAIILGSAPATNSTSSTFHPDVNDEDDSCDSDTNNDFYPDLFPDDSIADRFQKVWLLGDDRNVRKVFVQGRLVKSLD
jgi:guanine deaminase